jgi:large subunit ribosomal protein L13
MKTYLMKKEETDKKNWYLVDAKDKVLGRLAVKVARVLQGKNRPTYTPHVDNGDGVIVINAGEIVITGAKAQSKLYTRYSGYPGGLRVKNFEAMIKEKPEYVVRHAVKGMLPKNKLGERMIGRLKVYKGAQHKNQAQAPVKLEV